MVAFYKICRHKHGYNHTSDAVGVRLLSTAEEARLRVEADDNNDDNKNVSVDMQRQGAGDMFKAAQWQLGCTEDESGCVEFNVGDYHRQSLTDDVLHSCCADCSGGCYDDEMSTFYVNYQHQGETVADAVDSEADWCPSLWTCELRAAVFNRSAGVHCVPCRRPWRLRDSDTDSGGGAVGSLRFIH